MSSLTDPKVILLKGCPKGYEAPAAGSITPGMLLAFGDGTVVAHATTSAARFPCLVARDNEMVGGGIDDAYVIGERVMYYHMTPGDEFYGLLETGQNITRGALLASNAAGALEAVGANYPVVQAMESVNNASGVNARIRVRVL